jgi:hypothetical protein
MEIQINLTSVLEAGLEKLFPILAGKSPTYEIQVRKPNKKGGYTPITPINLGKDPQLIVMAFDK